MTKTTFYKHFGGKDDLMVAAVQRRDEWESQAWDRAVRKLAGDDPAGQLLALFDVMDLWFNDADFHGCMFMNTAAESPIPTIRFIRPPQRTSGECAIIGATSHGPPALREWTLKHSRIATQPSFRAL